MTVLNPERLALVTTALRSGEFPQGRCRLRNNNEPQTDPPSGWCCLGVICEVYRRETGRGEWRLTHNGKYYEFWLDGDAYSDYLPIPVWEWLGGSEADSRAPKRNVNPLLRSRMFGEAGASTASGWNDQGALFAEIATAFEEVYA